MSYKTLATDTTSYKDLDYKLQTLSAKVKSKLSWLSYAGGLADRIVEQKDGRDYIFPALWQGANLMETLSMMPSDLFAASCFWVHDGTTDRPLYNFARAWVNVGCIFYIDIKAIAPTANYRLSKTKFRQDIIEAFRQNQYCGIGILQHQDIIEDDITKIYEGFSVEQIDNRYKMLPKYCLRFNFKFGFLLECNSTFNTYS